MDTFHTRAEQKFATTVTGPSGTPEVRQVPWFFIYVQEAHAFDEWKMGQPSDIPQHKNLQDRAAAAQLAIKNLSLAFSVWVDEVTGGCGLPEHYGRCGRPNFERLYGAWPLRIVVFDHDATVLYNADSNNLDDMFELISGAIEKYVSFVE